MAPATGAQDIYGAIRTRWAEWGWERGTLGFPIEPEHDRSGGGRIQAFERGTVEWTSEGGAHATEIHFKKSIDTPDKFPLGGEASLVM